MSNMYIGKTISFVSQKQNTVYGVVENVDAYGWTIRITAMNGSANDEYELGELLFMNHVVPLCFKIVPTREMIRIYSEGSMPDEEINKIREADLSSECNRLMIQYERKHNFAKHDMISIDGLGMSYRAYHTLEKNNIRTLEELERYSSDELMSLPGVGAGTYHEIKRAMYAYRESMEEN